MCCEAPPIVGYRLYRYRYIITSTSSAQIQIRVLVHDYKQRTDQYMARPGQYSYIITSSAHVHSYIITTSAQDNQEHGNWRSRGEAHSLGPRATRQGVVVVWRGGVGRGRDAD